jgi:hypothetical protein
MTYMQNTSPEKIQQIGVQWPEVAAQRLAKLVELEHDYSVVHDRLSAVQSEYQQETRRLLGQLESLSQERDALADKLAELSLMQASFLSSRSWRVTKPLRDMSLHMQQGRRGFKRALRTALNIPFIRGVARRAASAMPGVGRRMHVMLYGPR